MLDETWVTHKIRTSRFMRVCWRKMGLPLLSNKIADEIWTTMTWAVYDGDVPVTLALRSLLGGERLHGGEVDPHGAWRGTRTMSKDGSTKLGFTTEGFSWTHPMARCAGEGKGLDTDDANTTPHGGCHSELARVDETASG